MSRLPEVGLTRTRLQKLIADGKVTVNDRPAGHNHMVYGGEKIRIEILPPEKSDIAAEEIPLNIAYEDDQVIVVDKPAGMVTHPAAGNYSGTLVNALMHYTRNLSRVHGEDRPGIIHRLDKNTSGLLLVAKNDKAHLFLQEQLQKRNIKRTYLALVCGHLKEKTGLIDLPIGRSMKDRKKMVVTHKHSREAQTKYKLLERFHLHDYLEINLQTGRTHQIRVHLAHLGHPVFGDPEYGGRLKWHRGIFAIDKVLAMKALTLINRQALHAARLEFPHPVSGKKIKVESSLPEDFAAVVAFMREGE